MEKIRVTDLTKRYGRVLAVDSASFSIQENEFFSLLGPSGCGKSTVLRCVAGLEEPTAGTIYIGETLVNSTSEGVNVPTEQRPIGMVFQNYAVWPHMTVAENVAYPLKLKKMARAQIRKKLEVALHAVGLGRFADRYPSQLSGGEQQRVAVARALIKEPEILLLDEPLSNLDAKLREQMRFELKDLQKRMGIPILYVTHDQTEAIAMSDRVAVMKDGRILQIGNPLDVYENPANEFIADFIGLMNFLQCKVLSRQDHKVELELHSTGERLSISDAGVIEGEALLAVRPENLALDKELGVSCAVRARIFLGNMVEYKVSVGDELLRVQATTEQDYKEGEKLFLRVKKGTLFRRNSPESIA
ncbi:MAG: ABC transporter ATP-binding protein [Deltaproteobacteria bacterium]|nr:ABC transporter ATP-binding protein [Deltaproteobacteria bacterium]